MVHVPRWLSGFRRMVVLGVLCATASVASGQTRLAALDGRVMDETGSALPGVTVTATSPALQVGQVVQVTGGDGTFRFPELPTGQYRLVFELAGFTSFVREGLTLTTGFTARVDTTLRVSALSETITVSGASPVVDTVNTRGGTTISAEVIQTIPNSRNYQDILNMTPGIRVTAPPQMGEVGFRALVGNIKTYGLVGQSQTQIEGLQMSESAFPDFSTAEQVDVRTYGNTADVAQPGAVTDVIVKSGGNTFHGRAHEQYMSNRFQSTNLDDALRAQGLRTGDGLRYYQDLAVDLGGRVVRDKLWFYGAYRDLRNERQLAGYAKAAGPDGRYGTLDDEPGYPTALQSNMTTKWSYQLNPANRLIAFWQRNWAEEPQAQASRFIPYEATRFVGWEPIQYKAEWQSSIGSRLFLNTSYGRTSEEIYYEPVTTNAPARFDRRTGISTGAYAAQSGSGTADIYGSISKRHMVNVSASTVATEWFGTHDIRVGMRAWLENRRSTFDNRPTGNYRLVLDNGQPAQITVWNFPIEARETMDEYAAFVMDQWRLSDRVTLNLGLRWETLAGASPEQVKEQGPFLAAGRFPEQKIVQWTNLAPRAAVAWDLFGTGKTLVKGTVGRYNHRITAAGYISTFNPVRPQAATFAWTDPDRNGDYTPGEVDLSLNGPAFVSITGATSNRINLDVKQPYTNEVTASLEQDLGRESSFRFLWVFKQVNGDYEFVNVLRPYSAYNIPITRRDPGPDGVLNTADDAGSVRFADFDPAFRGAAFVGNEYRNRPNPDRFHTVEATYVKRPSIRWNLITSFSLTKNHRWLDGIPESPNDEFFPIDNTWEWTSNVAGGYTMPKLGVETSVLYAAFSGLPGQRTYIFGPTDPDGGTPLRQLNAVTLRMEEFGARRGPRRHKVDFRVARGFRIRGAHRLRMEVDALNVINTNVAWGRGDVLGGTGIDFRSGPTFGYATQIVAPRIWRFGIVYEF